MSQMSMDDDMFLEQIEDSKNNETFDMPNPIEPGTLADLSNVTFEKLTAVQSGAMAEQEHITAMSMLYTSMRNIPESMDSER